MLASILLKEDEELTAERLEGAVRALRRIHIRRHLEQVQQRTANPEPCRLRSSALGEETRGSSEPLHGSRAIGGQYRKLEAEIGPSKPLKRKVFERNLSI